MFSKSLAKKLIICSQCPEADDALGCRATGEKINFAEPCPLGRWEMSWVAGTTKIEYDSETNRLWIARPDKLIEDQLDARYVRIHDKLQWQAGTEGFTAKAKDYLEARLSGRLLDDDPIVATRKRSCFGEEGTPRCTALVVQSDGAWCQACSCGRSKLANLDGSQSKLTFITLKCPRMMPGFSNHLPGATK